MEKTKTSIQKRTGRLLVANTTSAMLKSSAFNAVGGTLVVTAMTK